MHSIRRQLEQMEDRTVPAAYVWNGPDNGL